MNKLTLIRGVPGTGKSTWAHAIAVNSCPSPVVLEADMYFCRETGKYEFDFSMLGRAHDWCLNTTKVLLREGHDVIVANTFTTMREMNPYINFAVEFGVDISVVTLTEEYGSIHAVPEESMQRMRERFVDHKTVVGAISALQDVYEKE